jgi:hypothetical protein
MSNAEKKQDGEENTTVPKKENVNANSANSPDNSKKKKQPIIKAVELFLQFFKIRYNEILRQAEWLTSKGIYEPVNLHTLRRYLQHKGLESFSLFDLKSLLQSDFVPTYNPFKEFFQKLPKWDGITDYIGKFAGYVKTDKPDFFATMLKKHLVRAIQCALDGQPNRYVFVLYSKAQNIGKSTWIRFLAPLKNRYYSEGVLDGSKDTFLRMSQIFIWSMEELASLNWLEINNLKHIISLATIVERPPYEPFDIVVPRRVSFFGSSNRPEFLSDVTGNSRWLVFNIENIDFKYSKEVDINKIWSQAYALYLQGYDCQLNGAETTIQEETNKEYEVTYAEGDAVAQYLQKCRPDDPRAVFMTIREILDYLHQQTTLSLGADRQTLNPVKFSTWGIIKALTAGDYERARKYINSKQHRGYYVIPVPVPKVTDTPQQALAFDENDFFQPAPKPAEKPTDEKESDAGEKKITNEDKPLDLYGGL